MGMPPLMAFGGLKTAWKAGGAGMGTLSSVPGREMKDRKSHYRENMFSGVLLESLVHT